MVGRAAWTGTPASNGAVDAAKVVLEEDQRTRLRLRLQGVIDVFRKWLYLPDVGAIYAVLATIVANLMAGDPEWLLVVGSSSGGKTEIVNSAGALPHVYRASTITEAGLLSGSPKRDRDKQAKGGLLREVGEFGILLLKDFTSILSMNRDARAELLAALREIFDGSWTRRVGVDGGRTLDWQGKLGIVAGCTGAIDSHHTVMSIMGERFLFYRLPKLSEEDEQKQSEQALKNTDHLVAMRAELSAAVLDFFNGITLPEHPDPLSEDELRRLTALAQLAARCRSAVQRDSHSREIELILDPEAPARIVQALHRLYGGMVAIGVEEEEMWDVLVKVGLDCMPKIRRALFERLVASELKKEHGGYRTAILADAIGYPRTTARRALEDLEAHGVVVSKEVQKTATGDAYVWCLSDWARERYERATSVQLGGRSRKVGWNRV